MGVWYKTGHYVSLPGRPNIKKPQKTPVEKISPKANVTIHYPQPEKKNSSNLAGRRHKPAASNFESKQLEPTRAQRRVRGRQALQGAP